MKTNLERYNHRMKRQVTVTGATFPIERQTMQFSLWQLARAREHTLVNGHLEKHS